MNKQIEELALNIAQQVAPDGWLCGSDPVLEFTEKLLTELTKQSQPFGYLFQVNNSWWYFNKEKPPEDGYDTGCLVEVFTHPIPQPDLVAEIGWLTKLYEGANRNIHELRQQLSAANRNHLAAFEEAEELGKKLSAAQADNEQLVKALDKIADMNATYGPFPEANNDMWGPMAIVTAREALAAHKARQGKEQQ